MLSVDKFKGCLLGLAVGDCVGAPLEFKARDSYEPLTDLVGGGPFGLKAGQFTDDTSMALCIATSLIHKERFNPRDQMERYLMWRQEGYLSSTGRCFDIGTTVSGALYHFKRSGKPFAGLTHRGSAGNGSLMRLAPVPMFFAERLDKVPWFCDLSSKTTHGAPQAVDACRFYGALIASIFQGVTDVERWSEVLVKTLQLDSEVADAVLLAPFNKRSQVESTGYVVHSLGAALWSFYNSDNYRDCVLKAANLGGDSDTTAAIAGMLAGAYYGLSGIPEPWVDKLTMRIEMELMAEELLRLAQERGEAARERAA